MQSQFHPNSVSKDMFCGMQADKLAAAQFNVVHLIAAVAKLRPGWLPKLLFDLLHQRWLSPERRARCVPLLCVLPLCMPTAPLSIYILLIHAATRGNSAICTSKIYCFGAIQ